MSKRDGLYKRGPFWWISRDPISGKPESTKCRDREAARAVLAARERAAADPTHHARTSATLAGACRRLLTLREGLGKATTFHEQKLGHWCRIFGDGFALAELDAGAFDRYVATRREEGVTNHTINKEVGCMLTALRLAKREGRYAGDLSVLRPMGFSAEYKPRERALQPHELEALLAALPVKRHPFVALIVGLGVRRGEAKRLRPEHVDLEAWEVEVQGAKKGKQDRDTRRTIPVLKPFRGLVGRAAQSVPLEPWGNYLRDLGLACKKAGIARVTMNDLRRTHATLLRNHNVDKDTAKRLIGHSPSSTMLDLVYDKPTAGELAQRAGDLDTLTALLPGGVSAPLLQCERGPDSAACVSSMISGRARQESNLRPTAPEAVTTGLLGSDNNNLAHGAVPEMAPVPPGVTTRQLHSEALLVAYLRARADVLALIAEAA